ncbi:L-lactate dehydrogenase (cytochrome) [Geosmithia morbida]|uniref:L-lactate dehydrogenase (Cytochrome) n=1 Tax=Geosmithia morbida TaxID=1094350 RepID=A0A9P5D2B5_9HYPO|nr:L-lactate dehydrogenase (cytochrome) [Geosmithia morbida]KAF4119344.1 L-lactate dehydrogenase (cytochrome) [Geosmithia morbida]
MTSVDGAEVSRHSDETSCWIVIHGKVWDVTDFLHEHPGGTGVILKRAGRDATEAYDEVHDASLIEETLPAKRCVGRLADGTLIGKEETVKEPQPATSPIPPLNTIISVGDFERVAAQYLSSAGWAYYSSGADDELSIADARRLFGRITLRPRILRPVEPVSAVTDILGYHSSLPIYLSPTGLGKYAHKDAENIIAASAGKEGIIYCMPTGSSHQAIFNSRVSSDQPLFFQLYSNRDPERSKELIRKAERMGAAAVFVTVDTPVLGKREKDDRLRAAEGDDTLGDDAGGVAKVTSLSLLNPLLTWEDLKWMRDTTKLPIVLKGVQTVEDAVMAYESGVAGIVLSNHGGRSQDTAQSPIITLLEIRRYAPHILDRSSRHRFQVFVDGGVRRGTDVVKALALGATAVGIGRPVLYSMCGGYGEAGLRRMIGIFRAEIRTNMALAGAANVDGLVPQMVNSERAENEVSRRVKL